LGKFPAGVKIFRFAGGRHFGQREQQAEDEGSREFHAGLDGQLPEKVTRKQSPELAMPAA
jgi:hypothetical protein